MTIDESDHQPIQPSKPYMEFCIYCKHHYLAPILEHHDVKSCMGLMPDFDSTPVNEPWPPPPLKPKSLTHDDTLYWVVHPYVLVALTVASLFSGGCIGAAIALHLTELAS